MRGTMITIKADGTETVTFIERKARTATSLLPDLQKAVGGYIEQVPGFHCYLVEGVPMPCVALCNEEGKLHNLPLNEKATRLWRQQWRTTDVLVGDVVVLYGDDKFMAAL
jgi:hypothetical protein